MAMLCKRCDRINPAEAAYCYFDGVVLRSSQLDGPLDLAQAPFPTPFQFPAGQLCRNFDQLALSCQAHWAETWELLLNGGFSVFLAGLGRVDLAVAAAQAVAAADRDRGVDYFLARLPAHNLSAPRLLVAPMEMQFGVIRPNQDVAFDLVLTNDGHRLIVGNVTSDSDWLQVDGATPEGVRALQFSHEQTVRVRMPAAQLTASTVPRAGKILVQTNAGDAEVAVSCTVPVLPFPEGVLSDCRSPRELAKKSRRRPDEAAALFAEGKVEAWYQSNGWTYPVEGSPATGKAAVQQFFEALGLTQPPLVVLDTTSVVLSGAPGWRLQKKLRLHTDDKRPIFAFGRSFSPWLSIVETTANANRASVTIEAYVPETTVLQLETQLEVRANGNQRFHVPVILQIARGAAAAEHVPVPPTAPRLGGTQPLKALAAVYVCALVLTVAAGLLWLMQPAGRAALEPYGAAISPSTCMALEVDLEALAETRGLDTEARQLQKTIAAWLKDLDLQPRGVRPRRLFVALAPKARPLTVWTFDDRVQFGWVRPRRYKVEHSASESIYIDCLDQQSAWAVDTQGRLVGGEPEDVRAVLRRKRSAQNSLADGPLAQAAPMVLPGTLAWAAGDFKTLGADMLNGLLADDVAPVALTQFHLQIATDTDKGLVLRGSGTFPAEKAAEQGRERLRGMSRGAVPMLPALDLGDLLRLRAADWPVDGPVLRVEASLVAEKTGTILARAREALGQAHQERQAILQKGDYDEDLRAAHKHLKSDKLLAARSLTNRWKSSPLVDKEWIALDSAVTAAELDLKLHNLLKTAKVLTGRDDIDELCKVFKDACDLNKADPKAAQGLDAAQRVRSVAAALQLAEKHLSAERDDDAHDTLIEALRQLPATSPPWNANPFMEHRERLLHDGATAGLKAYNKLKQSAIARREQADRFREQKKLVEAVDDYEQARQRLQRADAMLAELRALDDKRTPGAAEGDWLKKQLADLGTYGKAARIEGLLAHGDKEIGDGKSALEVAAANPKLVRGALEKLQGALKACDDANALERGVADDRIPKLNELHKNFGRILRPVTLDTSKALAADDWKYNREHWQPRGEGTSERRWLQAQTAKPVTLQSASRTWPADFVLEMDLAATDGYGKINNLSWADHTDLDPLTIVLEGPPGVRTMVALGNDPKYKFDRVASVKIDRQAPFRLDDKKDLAGDKPMRLVLRSEGPRDGVEMLAVTLNDRPIGETKLAGPVQSVKLCAANPTLLGAPRWFVAIYRVEVRWKGVK